MMRDSKKLIMRYNEGLIKRNIMRDSQKVIVVVVHFLEGVQTVYTFLKSQFNLFFTSKKKKRKEIWLWDRVRLYRLRTSFPAKVTDLILAFFFLALK